MWRDIYQQCLRGIESILKIRTNLDEPTIKDIARCIMLKLCGREQDVEVEQVDDNKFVSTIKEDS